jgi:hypothetical protein
LLASLVKARGAGMTPSENAQGKSRREVSRSAPASVLVVFFLRSAVNFP